MGLKFGLGEKKKVQGSAVFFRASLQVKFFMPLPEDPISWIKYLHDHFLRTESECTARALFSMIILGRFNGADVFERGGAGFSETKTNNSNNVPKFLKKAHVDFGIADSGPVANEDQSLLYFSCLASLAKRFFTLADLLPASLAKCPWIHNFDDCTDPILVEAQWQMARDLRDGEGEWSSEHLATEEKHTVLVVWAFWALSYGVQTNGAPLKVDLLSFGPNYYKKLVAVGHSRSIKGG